MHFSFFNKLYLSIAGIVFNVFLYMDALKTAAKRNETLSNERAVIELF